MLTPAGAKYWPELAVRGEWGDGGKRKRDGGNGGKRGGRAFQRPGVATWGFLFVGCLLHGEKVRNKDVTRLAMVIALVIALERIGGEGRMGWDGGCKEQTRGIAE